MTRRFPPWNLFLSLFIPSQAQRHRGHRLIFREYANSLNVDLAFQDFDAELASLPGKYDAPRGSPAAGQRRWCDSGLLCALRALDARDYPNAAEMKRLYVRRAFAVLVWGANWQRRRMPRAKRGYATVLLDTLDDMESARALNKALKKSHRTTTTPVAGAHYLKVVWIDSQLAFSAACACCTKV